MEIVEIGREPKSANRPLNVFLDVGGRVGHFPLRPENVESALGGHCTAT
jgi:hypothetical protein